MITSQPSGGRRWRVPIGLLALGAVLVWPAAGIADPSCSVRPSNPTVNAGDSVRWSASVSDFSSDRRSYRWELGGGSPSSSESASPTVRYSQAGSFETKLKVSDRRREAECKTTVTVRSGDTQPPAVSIGASPAGPTYTSAQNVSITANASDQDGVTRVEFYDNGNLRGTDSSAPYAYQWAVDASANGTHAWTARAYDPSGNPGTSNTLNLTVNIGGGGGPGPAPDVSINSTAQDSQGQVVSAVPQQPRVVSSNYSVLAINDLGMHCGDLDTRIASILPPFQVLLAQVIRKGSEPDLNPSGIQVYYSAAANPNDPILAETAFDGLKADKSTYKTNFWDLPVPAGTYDAFYPAYDPLNPAQNLTPLAGPPFNVSADVGLPVPNVEEFYIGEDGLVDACKVPGAPGARCDGTLTAVVHAMPGIAGPYTVNQPKLAKEHYLDKPFFLKFPFGYVADDVDWYEGAGIPFAAFDDFGRENAYPLVRVQAKQGSTVVATVDTVLPISGEANCTNCHADPADVQDSRTSIPTQALKDAKLPVAISLDDPDPTLPDRVSVEYAADINVLRLHDLKHGGSYVVPSAADDGSTVPAKCNIFANSGNGDANCLTNRALVQNEPVVCQVCHYTPALDLAQLGPLTGPEGGIANGRNQVSHQSNSRVMHNHHGTLTDANGDPLLDNDGNPLFPSIEPPTQADNGAITNQGDRLAQLEDSCYQCHPGKNVRCLRGAMFNGGMLCSDCHGDMEAVGADFSAGVSPSNPGKFKLGLGNFYQYASAQPRVPWANEPGCGSCHTGDATSNVLTNGNDGISAANVIVNKRDINNNPDGIRLRQAFRKDDAKATPIVPVNTRFAENPIPQRFNGFNNPGFGTIADSGGARNPKLYRVSTGHEGVMCEGCHGATHAEWPNANPNANDNVTAKQLQGHTGTIVECSTCHGAGWEPSRSEALDGPHGMHVVGNTDFADGGHEDIAEDNPNACRACHGSNGQGTVLARMSVDRVLDCDDGGAFCGNANTKLFPKGKMVRCDDCHGNEL